MYSYLVDDYVAAYCSVRQRNANLLYSEVSSSQLSVVNTQEDGLILYDFP